ncbi:hypothetical protein IPC1338_31785 [Pseudomonas aeruginosa]|nr:hypothetical protein IPC1338_31785 [Pseudomonas aeruginosa]
MSCPNLALVHTSIEHSRDWCRRLLILGCQEPYAHQALHPVRWCGRLLKTTPGFLPRRMRPCPTTPEDVQSAHSIELALCRKGTFQSHLTIDRSV